MTYREAVQIWREANPHVQAMPDHARSTLVSGSWHMHSAGPDGYPLGSVDAMTGRFFAVGT